MVTINTNLPFAATKVPPVLPLAPRVPSFESRTGAVAAFASTMAILTKLGAVPPAFVDDLRPLFGVSDLLDLALGTIRGEFHIVLGSTAVIVLARYLCSLLSKRLRRNNFRFAGQARYAPGATGGPSRSLACAA